MGSCYRFAGRSPRYFTIASGAIPDFTARFQSVQVTQIVSSREILTENHPLRVLVPNAAVDPLWRTDINFDDSTWLAGNGGIGYDTGSGYETYIDVNLETDMSGKQTSALVPIEFDYQPPAGADFAIDQCHAESGAAEAGFAVGGGEIRRFYRIVPLP